MILSKPETTPAININYFVYNDLLRQTRLVIARLLFRFEPVVDAFDG
jgi:hypothetical protein